MSRHSRNNTNASCFTYAERQMLDYGTKEQRMGRDSMKDFDACYLCLQRLREPLSCDLGHLACKECLYENILAQRAEVARHKRLVAKQESRLQRAQSSKEQSLDEEKEREFVRLQTSLVSSASLPIVTKADASSAARPEPKPASASLSLSLPTAAAQTGRASNSEREPTNQLTSFWVPSLTPSEAPSVLPSQIKVEIVCSVGQHPISVKKLIPVHFALSENNSIICPCCHKTCTNTSHLALIRPCGHVVCQPCLKASLACDTPSGRGPTSCPVCSRALHVRDILPLAKDGTGFAAGGGKVLVRKYDTAFQ